MASGIFQQLFRRLAEAIEVGPPGRAGLAPVIFQQLTRKPAGAPGVRPRDELFVQPLAGVENLGGLWREWLRLGRGRPGEIGVIGAATPSSPSVARQSSRL